MKNLKSTACTGIFLLTSFFVGSTAYSQKVEIDRSKLVEITKLAEKSKLFESDAQKLAVTTVVLRDSLRDQRTQIDSLSKQSHNLEIDVNYLKREVKVWKRYFWIGVAVVGLLFGIALLRFFKIL